MLNPLLQQPVATTGPTDHGAAAFIADKASGTPPDETPASTRSLLDTADLTTKSEQEGFRPEVSDGEVLYCRKVVDFSEQQRDEMRVDEKQSGVSVWDWVLTSLEFSNADPLHPPHTLGLPAHIGICGFRL